MEKEFNPINTQEEFDAAVTARYGDIGNLQQQINTLTGERDTHAQTIAARDKTIAELQGKVKGYEATALKQRIAKEKNIPLDMASRLTGETEKDLRADADAMAGTLRAYKGAAPLADHQEHEEEGNRAGLRRLLRNMKGE